MQRDPNATDKARRAERKADEKSGLISIKPIKLEPASSSASNFKKGGFKSAFGASKAEDEAKPKPTTGFKKIFGADDEPAAEDPDAETDSDEFNYDYYDPRRPTGCDEGCSQNHH